MLPPRRLPGLTPDSLRQPIQVHHTDAWGPPQYTNWVEESMSWKETCYIGDWTLLPSVRYRGPDVLRLFADITVNSMSNFEIGQSKHAVHCNGDGMIIEEGVLTRTGDDEVIAHSTLWADYWRSQGDYDVEPAEYLELAKLHVQGPTSLFVLEKVSGSSLRDARFMRSSPITIAGHAVDALRQGMTGEIGFELQLPIAHAPEVWAAIVEAGQEFGIKQMGSRVLMINHLEANYPTHSLDFLPAIFGEAERGYLQSLIDADDPYIAAYYGIAGSFESDDISDWYRSPVELGWGNRIKFDHDFLGREALRAELASPRRMIATLVWNSDDVLGVYAEFFRQNGPLPDFMEMPQEPRGYFWTDKVLRDGQLVGTTSSRGYSAYFRQMISLCVIDLEHREPGTEVTVIWGNPGTPQREIRATVAPAPYKPDRGRVDLATLPSYR